MQGLGDFLAMGGYAAYVWPALLVTAAVMGGLWVASARRLKAREAALAALARKDGDGAEA